MKTIVEKFYYIKTHIGGNREKMHFEDTFGMPREEQMHITPPGKDNVRIISELDFAIRLTKELQGIYDAEVEQALDYLVDKIDSQGVLTAQDCESAENFLLPMQEACKEYHLILAAHAHMDMNWMWGYTETVALVLATCRSILNIMDEYPEFCFSQSQGAVYKIVEEYDPAMMEEIKTRIAEGRWEVTATAWVETDKNMPEGESLLRHIQYTREYLEKKWGVKDFDLDFSPDTFGHSANVPEINRFGNVKYYYHCRGNARKDVLYRFRAPSGNEVITYREPNWYNGAITPQIGAGLIEISHRSSGLKTGLVIYGVGDHGGGPTRRDVERALDMMNWKIYPQVKFGTIRQYFKEAEKIQEKLPIVDQELNYFSPGCYTTQSRIKRGNKRLEAALLDAETLGSLSFARVGHLYAKEQMKDAWRNVLFTHFHDILTGSCVQDTREHAMGLYQTSMAVANTQLQNAMRAISMKIDTSSIPVDIDGYYSQSEGAGAGYGIENFVGVPSTERGSGKTRIFHVFNTRPVKRTEVVELTVWDWTGDLRRIQLKDYHGNLLPYQVLDEELCTYWDHKYVRVLVRVSVPACGYTTVVLSQSELLEYPVYLQESSNQVARLFDDHILENEYIRVRIDAHNGRISSLTDKETGEELIQKEKSAGLNFVDTETASSSAWNIGRHLANTPVDQCLNLEKVSTGELRNSVKATYSIRNSKVEITYVLEAGARALRIEMKIDWHEIGNETIPVLDYKVPLSYTTDEFLYDVPAGIAKRAPLSNDVPGLKFGLAKNASGKSAVLISDCKYGYRGYQDALGLTLINSSTSPDPYPERGIHMITLWLGSYDGKVAGIEEMAWDFQHKLFYQPSNCHTGTLSMEDSFVQAEGDNVFISAIETDEEGNLLIRGYELGGEKSQVKLSFQNPIAKAETVNLFGEVRDEQIEIDGKNIRATVKAYSIFELKIKLETAL